MATTAKPTTKSRSKSTRKSTAKNAGATTRTQARSTSGRRSDASQVREGVTKARNGAASYVRQTAERGVDLPVGAALTVRDRVGETVDSWTRTELREKELKSIRTQVTRELNKFERRGGQARRKATSRVRQTRNRVEREVKSRRRSIEKQIKQNRTKVETAVKERVAS